MKISRDEWDNWYYYLWALKKFNVSSWGWGWDLTDNVVEVYKVK